ncbi:MAG: hypothetical protein HZC28_11175 [Spirochaetes bacterium]|nr:hypothetical protein [Spirochaetota bacterium]
MTYREVYDAALLTQKARTLFADERKRTRLDGWFIVQEIRMRCAEEYRTEHPEAAAAKTLLRIAEELPISIHRDAVFAGTQRDAFARSYALINPAFTMESFAGYCDPLAVYNDIEPDAEFTAERIEKVRSYFASTPYVRELKRVYAAAEGDTKEVAYFVEQVTGHTIADFRPVLANGIISEMKRIDEKLSHETDADKRAVLSAMKISFEAVLKLAFRYGLLAKTLAQNADEPRHQELMLISETLMHVPLYGARNLYEAIQSFMLLWQLMCLEQSPNPYAFSVGNIDRILEPFRAMDNCGREHSAALMKHLLTFFNVGDRSWAISQNLMIGGRDEGGNDLTNNMSSAVLDAYFECNYPQPILSVKLHSKTPKELYESLGRFFFTPGMLTPSLFNDDALFAVLTRAGVQRGHMKDYAIAGCQEPLIMGKENANTTASWLNLAKVLELTLSGGVSAITGEHIGPERAVDDPLTYLKNIRSTFKDNLEHFIGRMTSAANGCAKALSLLRVPFLSSLMGGIDSGIDMRDAEKQGTVYNGCGCLIHGLSVVADSFTAIDALVDERPGDAGKLLSALRNDFADAEDLRQFLAAAPKYGNNITAADGETRKLAVYVAERISARKNYLGNPFRPDFSSPSTHLLYGYWTGATPDGRHAREMLGYGIDPLFGEAVSGLGFRTLSVKKMPFELMTGGYASHFGIDPRYFPEASFAEKGQAFADRVIAPLFFSGDGAAPFYLYVNVNTPAMLRKVLAHPERYAPNGIYIMRIHGTFVNFLDLSPAIQDDIIKRLDPVSTAV